jgi:hypothetical protein
LRKLKPLHERPALKPEIPSHARFLHLGFALKNEFFHETHIKHLTKELPLVDIRWLGCRKMGTPKLGEIAQFVTKNRRDLAVVTPPPTERKRSADEADLDTLDIETQLVGAG